MVEIVKATPQDIPQLCGLLNSLFSQEAEFVPDENAQTKGLSTILAEPNIGHILVAKKEDELIGMVNILYTISTALGAKVAILEDMFILESYRNQGIGSKLIKFAVDFAKKNGCKRITLLSDENNTAAHTFYAKEGFTRSTMVPFRLSLSDD